MGSESDKGIVLGVSPGIMNGVRIYLSFEDFENTVGSAITKEFIGKLNSQITNIDSLIQYDIIYIDSIPIIAPYNPNYLITLFHEYMCNQQTICATDINLLSTEYIGKISSVYDTVFYSDIDYSLVGSNSSIKAILYKDKILINTDSSFKTSYKSYLKCKYVVSKADCKRGLLYENNNTAWFTKQDFDKNLISFFEQLQTFNMLSIYIQDAFYKRMRYEYIE